MRYSILSLAFLLAFAVGQANIPIHPATARVVAPARSESAKTVPPAPGDDAREWLRCKGEFLASLGRWTSTPDAMRMSAFVAGAVGMSLADSTGITRLDQQQIVDRAKVNAGQLWDQGETGKAKILVRLAAPESCFNRIESFAIPAVATLNLCLRSLPSEAPATYSPDDARKFVEFRKFMERSKTRLYQVLLNDDSRLKVDDETWTMMSETAKQKSFPDGTLHDCQYYTVVIGQPDIS